MQAMRRFAQVGLGCALAALIAAGASWAAPAVKRTPALTQSVVKDHRQISSAYDELSQRTEGTVPAAQQSVGLRASSASSPGIVICSDNVWDYQHPDGTVREVAALGGGGIVHFGWTHWDVIPDSVSYTSRLVNYNAYSTASGLLLGNCGFSVGDCAACGDILRSRAGYIGVEVGSDNNAHLIFQMRDEANQFPNPDRIYSSWVFDQQTPGQDVFDDAQLPQSVDAEAVYPHAAIDRGGSATRTPGDDVYHVCSRVYGYNVPFYTTELFYWRRVGEYPAVWEGPVVLDLTDGGSLSHHVATDPTDENVAVIYASDLGSPWQLMQVLYCESADNGNDWITAGVPIFPTPVGPQVNGGRRYVTNYTDPDGPQAWFDCTGEYDSQGRLHIVWVQQETADEGNECRILHWSDFDFTARTIVEAVGWPNTGTVFPRSLWLSAPQIGLGDGNTLCTDGPVNPGGAGVNSNLDYVYVTFEQYGGPTSAEANDVSTHNIYNSEIYLAVSNDRGASWAKPVNLTNTQTPGCDGNIPGNECASEKDPSINLIVDDTIHVFYYLDLDAGESNFAFGSWTYNSMMYYRIPGGTNTQPMCPALEPRFAQLLSRSDADCEYHAPLNPPGTVVEQLSIFNYGNELLTGSVGVTPPSATWLQVSSAAFSVIPGSPPDVRPVTMDAGDASIAGEGLYSAQIEITHNDPAVPSPFPVPVDFFVFDNFFCPEYQTLHTDCLWLEVSNTERIGNQNYGLSGLTRLGSDSSWSVYDGSLIVGVPPSPDTLVYHSVYGGGNGYPGFRALSNLTVDTSAYGTFAGEATASAVQTTTDSTIGIGVEYVFPQDPDSCEFVLIKYDITNNSGSDMLGLAIGEAVDLDVTPGGDLRGVQPEQQNTAHLRTDFNMIYQQGVDSTGHPTGGDNTATRFKTGITLIACYAAPRAWNAPNDQYLDNTASGGFEDGYLWREMTKTGFEIFPPDNPDPEEDIHTVLVFDNDVDLAPGEARHYVMALVSSNTGTNEADLINTTKTAWRYAFGWEDVVIEDTVDEFTPASYPYRAVGSHEGGLPSGCCGCVVSKVSGSSAFTIAPGPNPCEGTIEFAGLDGCCFPVSAEFKLTDLCGDYEDVFTITLQSNVHCNCVCPYQCDFDADGFLTAIDLGVLIDVLFAGRPDVQDPNCPDTRADFDCDCFATALDLNALIDHLFAGGPPPCAPCTSGGCAFGCD